VQLEQTDVVVVGGGISGVATAFALRSRGFDVVLLEQRFLAFGSSGRSLGGVWSQDVTTPEQVADLRATHALYERLVADHGVDASFTRAGGVTFAETEAEAEAVERRVQAQRALGLDVSFVSGEEARRVSAFVPDSAIAAAVSAEDARVDLASLVRALGAACTQLGVRAYEHTPVLRAIRYGDDVAGVLTMRGEVRASAVVWAAGPWVQQLEADGISVPLEVVRVGMLQTQPTSRLSEMMAQSATHLLQEPGAPLRFEETFVQNAEGRLLIGNTYDRANSLNPHLTADAAAHLIGALHRRQPQLGSLGVTGLWAGLVGATPDRQPIIDRTGGLYLNVGHVSGALSGLVSGEHVAQLIAGETTDDRLGRFAIDRPMLTASATTG